MQPSTVLSPDALHTATADLLRDAGLEGEFSLHLLPGGGNNRVFRVDVDGTRALLKAYFQHPEDRRDRLGAEYSFCAFAWDNGVRSLPRPLAQDRANHLGLYEFIDGRKLRPEEIDGDAIRQAMTFFAEVNRHRSQPEYSKSRKRSRPASTQMALWKPKSDGDSRRSSRGISASSSSPRARACASTHARMRSQAGENSLRTKSRASLVMADEGSISRSTLRRRSIQLR